MCESVNGNGTERRSETKRKCLGRSVKRKKYIESKSVHSKWKQKCRET